MHGSFPRCPASSTLARSDCMGPAYNARTIHARYDVHIHATSTHVQAPCRLRSQSVFFTYARYTYTGIHTSTIHTSQQARWSIPALDRPSLSLRTVALSWKLYAQSPPWPTGERKRVVAIVAMMMLTIPRWTSCCRALCHMEKRKRRVGGWGGPGRGGGRRHTFSDDLEVGTQLGACGLGLWE